MNATHSAQPTPEQLLIQAALRYARRREQMAATHAKGLTDARDESGYWIYSRLQAADAVLAFCARRYLDSPR